MINRGNYRRDLFAPAGAAASFQSCLLEAAERFGWRLHAFVVMRNHYHLALETPEPNLSSGMQWLQGTWAARFNRFRGEIGRPFQGRYKALHVEPGHALAQVAHYIHLNPVRAKIVTAERLMDFRSSSLWLFGQKARPGVLEAGTVLAESGGLPDTPAGWKRYLRYLSVLAEEESRLRDKKFGRLSRGWVIGSAEFKAELTKDLKARAGEEERFMLMGADAEGQREMRAEVWEERLRLAAKSLGIALDRLPEQKSAREKVQLAAAMKAATSVSNGWLAERLMMGEPASVSQYVRRFHLAGGGSAKAFKAVLSKVKRDHSPRARDDAERTRDDAPRTRDDCENARDDTARARGNTARGWDDSEGRRDNAVHGRDDAENVRRAAPAGGTTLKTCGAQRPRAG